MKTFLTTIIVALLGHCLAAQDYGVRIDPKSGFEARLTASGAATRSIVCRMKMVRRSAMLSGTVETEGTFYYSRPGRICMLFDHPKGDLLLISNGTIKSVTGGHTTVASSARNPAIRQVNDMITSCMTGNVSFWEKSSTTEYYEDATAYTVVITPTAQRVQRYISRMVLRFDKADMTLDTLTMHEKSGDLTTYTYHGKQVNAEIDPSVFNL